MKTIYCSLLLLFVCFASFGIGPITGRYYLPGRNFTSNLTDATPGGIWSSSNPGIASINSTGLVTAISAGTTTISYTVGTSYATTIISVDSYPAFFKVHWLDTTYSGNACMDDPRFHLYMDGSEPGVSYTIENGTNIADRTRTFIGTGFPIDIGRLWFDAGGLRYTSGYITASATNARGLIMFTPPNIAYEAFDTAIAITGSGTVCNGSSILLTDTNYIYNDGHWRSSNPLVATVASFTDSTVGFVTGISPGTVVISYSLTSTAGVGCISIRTKTITVTASVCTSAPIAGTISGNQYICPGTNNTLYLIGYTSCIHLQWQSSTDSLHWSDIAGQIYDSLIFNTQVSKWYRCKTTCPNSGLSSYTSSFHVYRRFTIATNAVIHNSDTTCNLAHFRLSACGISHDPLHVITWFGDGTSANVVLTDTLNAHANIYHQYNSPGSYSVKQVLYNGTTPQDSISFPYEYIFCNYLPLKFFIDVNHNGVFDSGLDKYNIDPMDVIVDSNGITIDTINALSGMYYQALGHPGTVYSFRPILHSSDLHLSCPISGVIKDTIVSSINNYENKYFGFSCASGSMFDLKISVAFSAGRHMADGTIIIQNPYCLPHNAHLKFKFSPKYRFTNSYPSPSSISSQTIIWNLSTINNINWQNISFHLDVPGGWDSIRGAWNTAVWLRPGDTINSSYTITSTGTELDTTNNYIERNDTVKSSYDPNEMEVSPQGNILPCTKLQYTVRFENTGNGPAQNIAVLDTLPAGVDMRSLQIVAASAAMNVVYIKNAGYNIVKFDFPNINLLDSSHHNECDGMVVFTVKVRQGLSRGTNIANRAGIYFDDNEVVMTNSVLNTIGISPILGLPAVCLDYRDTLYDAMNGGIWACTNAHATVVNGIVTPVSSGIDTVKYTVSNSCASYTTTKEVTIKPVAIVGAITGSIGLCVGNSTILHDTSTGGAWVSSDTSILTIDSTGLVHGIGAGMASISYQLNPLGCNAATAGTSVSIFAYPTPYVVSGGGNFCSDTGAIISLSSSETGVTYSLLYNGIIIPGSTMIGTGTALHHRVMSSGTYTINGSSFTDCFTQMTDSAVVTINPLPTVYNLSGGGAYCVGDSGVKLNLDNSQTGITYSLINHGTPAGTPLEGTGSRLDFGWITDTGRYTATGINILSNCSSNMTGNRQVSRNKMPMQFELSGGGTYCVGDSQDHLILASSETGVRYEFYRTGLLINTIIGTGLYIDAGKPEQGIYISTATNPLTHCTDTLLGSVVVAINNVPNVYSVTNGGNKEGIILELSGSDTGITYSEIVNGTTLEEVNGTGSAIRFGKQTVSGTYTIIATDKQTQCTSVMSGNVVFSKDPTVHLSPNPAHNQLTLEMEKDAYTTYTISNDVGQVLANETLGAGTTVINIRNLASGMYFITFRGSQGTKVMRFVKE